MRNGIYTLACGVQLSTGRVIVGRVDILVDSVLGDAIRTERKRQSHNAKMRRYRQSMRETVMSHDYAGHNERVENHRQRMQSPPTMEDEQSQLADMVDKLAELVSHDNGPDTFRLAFDRGELAE